MPFLVLAILRQKKRVIPSQLSHSRLLLPLPPFLPPSLPPSLYLKVESQQVDMPFLVLATLRQNKRVIRYLLSQGVENVNIRDDASGNTPLHYAIMMLDGEKEDGTF